MQIPDALMPFEDLVVVGYPLQQILLWLVVGGSMVHGDIDGVDQDLVPWKYSKTKKMLEDNILNGNIDGLKPEAVYQ